MTATEVPRCQSWKVRRGEVVQCELPAYHEGAVHNGTSRGVQADWHDELPNVLNGVCILCGSGVLYKTQEHLRDDLEPCYGGTT